MHDFDQILNIATANVPSQYFQLPVDGQEDLIYRERVYCYELYHQLRTVWPENTQYSLGGEVDKSGHRLIRGNGLDNCKPDFLVHVPGDMGGNFAIIEVKTIKAIRSEIKKDVATLISFLDYAGYERAILLFYGRKNDGNGIEIARDESQGDNAQRIEIWHHADHGESAIKIN